jgi:hypothetical protein
MMSGAHHAAYFQQQFLEHLPSLGTILFYYFGGRLFLVPGVPSRVGRLFHKLLHSISNVDIAGQARSPPSPVRKASGEPNTDSFRQEFQKESVTLSTIAIDYRYGVCWRREQLGAFQR